MEAVVFCMLILNEKLFVDLFFKVAFFKKCLKSYRYKSFRFGWLF